MSDEPSPQLQIETQRLLEIIQQENPMAYELALRRATIEAQARVIEELTALTRSGDTVP